MKIATLVIITRGNQVLLGLKKDGSEIGEGTLNAPGGKVESGETLLECLVREVFEEVGIELDPLKAERRAIITFHAGGIPNFEVHVYRTSDFIGEPHETKSMVPDWYDIDTLPVYDMLESDHTWFLRAVRGEKFRANVYYRKRAEGFERIEFFVF
ncbi:8-oxo-dGTP diphosphatase [Candidatus Kaiserbacteria bacterium]|nr:8-oxo-dGTP diphosphatase [Candidatus Kaiserbacteria bacterium]